MRLYADCNAGTVDAAGHHLSELADPSTPEGRERFATVARDALSRGFTALKFDVDDAYGSHRSDEWNRSLNAAQIERMASQVATIREAIGPRVDLAIDMHARFDVPSAIRAARALEPFDLMWLEEPVPPENLAALAEVRRATVVPICAGENLYTRFPFKDLLAAGAVDCVMPDVAKFGGLAEGRRVAELAELHYLPFAPHNVSGPIGTVAAAHLCAAVANFTVLEYHAMDLTYFEDLATFAGGPVVRDGHVHHRGSRVRHRRQRGGAAPSGAREEPGRGVRTMMLARYAGLDDEVHIGVIRDGGLRRLPVPSLSALLAGGAAHIDAVVGAGGPLDEAVGEFLAPIDGDTEVWAAGVT